MWELMNDIKNSREWQGNSRENSKERRENNMNHFRMSMLKRQTENTKFRLRPSYISKLGTRQLKKTNPQKNTQAKTRLE